VLLRARQRPPLVPLSPAQQRIWFLNRFETSSAGCNLPFVVRLRGAVDVAALRSALDDVLAGHEELRTGFPAVSADGTEDVVARQVVAALLERVRETGLAAFGNAELPFEQLVDAINPNARRRAIHCSKSCSRSTTREKSSWNCLTCRLPPVLWTSERPSSISSSRS
jgi:hypothetical protein